MVSIGKYLVEGGGFQNPPQTRYCQIYTYTIYLSYFKKKKKANVINVLVLLIALSWSIRSKIPKYIIAGGLIKLTRPVQPAVQCRMNAGVNSKHQRVTPRCRHLRARFFVLFVCVCLIFSGIRMGRRQC